MSSANTWELLVKKNKFNGTEYIKELYFEIIKNDDFFSISLKFLRTRSGNLIIEEAIFSGEFPYIRKNLNNFAEVELFLNTNGLPDIKQYNITIQDTEELQGEGIEITSVNPQTIKRIIDNTIDIFYNSITDESREKARIKATQNVLLHSPTPPPSAAEQPSAASSLQDSPSMYNLPPLPATTNSVQISNDIYSVIGKGGYGMLVRPQLKQYDNFEHHFMADDSIAPKLTYDKRYYRVTKLLKSKASALKEIKYTKDVLQNIDDLSSIGKSYFFPEDQYSYYNVRYRDEVGTLVEDMYLNMPYGGNSMSDLIKGDNCITITPEILENISKHHVFMMEEVFEKIKLKKFYHNDVKPQNFVFYENSPDDFDVKIIDFGLSFKLNSADFADLPYDLRHIQGYYFNYPMTKLLFSYIYMMETDSSLDFNKYLNINENLYLFKIIETIRIKCKGRDHYTFVAGLNAIYEIANQIPDFTTRSTKINEYIAGNPIYKLIINYVRSIALNKKTPRPMEELKQVLMQNYFEMLDIYGLLTTYLFILNQLIINESQFSGFDNDVLKRKLILFCRNILFTNHKDYDSSISYLKEMVKAHLSMMHVSRGNGSGTATATAYGGGNGRENAPELSAFDKLKDWNYTVDETALKQYQEELANFNYVPMKKEDYLYSPPQYEEPGNVTVVLEDIVADENRKLIPVDESIAAIATASPAPEKTNFIDKTLSGLFTPTDIPPPPPPKNAPVAAAAAGGRSRKTKSKKRRTRRNK